MSDRAEADRGGLALAHDHRTVLAAFAADGSHAHVTSRSWAVAEAAARNARLRIVMLTSAPTPGPMLEAVAGGGLDARLAELLVVGTSGAAADEDAVTSVLASLPRSGRRRLACPVIVLRGTPCRQPIRRIVVGISSAEVPAAALRWAVVEATIHRADVVLVHAWRRATEADGPVSRGGHDRSDARRVVDRAVRACRGWSDIGVHGDVVEGDAGDILVTASLDADLLVIGSRERSGFTTMLFGPATAFVIGAAACPVALVDPQVGPP